MQVQSKYLLSKSLSRYCRAKQNKGAGFSDWIPSSPSWTQNHEQGQATNSHGSQQGSKASDPPEDTRDAADLDPVVKPYLQPNLITITESENINDEVPTWAELYTKRYRIPAVLKKITCFRNIQER